MTDKSRNILQEAIMISLGDGRSITIDELGKALKGLPASEVIKVTKKLLIAIGGKQFKLLIDALEIGMTSSAFSKERTDQLPILEKAAQDFSLSLWLEQMGVSCIEVKREHVIAWWETFMLMASERGYTAGQISEMNRQNNLWKATSGLALKMQTNPSAYGFLPALLINHPTEVARVLNMLTEPIPFLEVLTGEAIEDMRKSKIFLGAFCTVQKNGEIDRSAENAVLSVALALQRG